MGRSYIYFDATNLDDSFFIGLPEGPAWIGYRRDTFYGIELKNR